MAHIERMPKSGYTMREGLVTRLLVQEGERVLQGTPLLEYETDKLTGTVEAGRDGLVLQILVQEGESRPVLAPLVVIGQEGEAFELEEGDPPVSPDRETPAAKAAKMNSGKIWIPATPCARRLAGDRGIPLAGITGTGPNGRIRKQDVLHAAEKAPRATHLAERAARDSGVLLEGLQGSGPRGRIQREDIPSVPKNTGTADVRREKLSPMRRTIAARLTESKRTIPHAYYTRDLPIGALAEIRQSIGACGEIRLTYNDLLLFALSRALLRHPALTAALDGDEVSYPNQINLGMAVSVEGGLVVPVIRDAGRRSLTAISREAARLARAAREKALTQEDMTGGCFTLSNLGKYGVRSFSAIINPPEPAILAVGAVEDRVCVRNGEIAVEKLATVTLSADHRLVDGAQAALFLQSLEELVREPWRMLL